MSSGQQVDGNHVHCKTCREKSCPVEQTDGDHVLCRADRWKLCPLKNRYMEIIISADYLYCLFFFQYNDIFWMFVDLYGRDFCYLYGVFGGFYFLILRILYTCGGKVVNFSVLNMKWVRNI